MKLANFELTRNSQGIHYLVEHTSHQIWLIRKTDQPHAMIYLNRIPLSVAVTVVIWVYWWPYYVAVPTGALLYGVFSYLFYKRFILGLVQLNSKERTVLLANLPKDPRSKQTRQMSGFLYIVLGFLLVVYAYLWRVSTTNLIITHGVAVISISRGLRDFSVSRYHQHIN